MNKNIKKVATVILATNVLASTVLTTLPAGTYATSTQENTETSVTSPIVNPIITNSTHITGKVDPHTSSIKVQVHNPNQSVLANYEFTDIDTDGSFNISVANMHLEAGMSISISQVVNGVESSITKTPVQFPKLNINPLTVSSTSVQLTNAEYLQLIKIDVYDKNGAYLNRLLQKMAPSGGNLTFNIDLSRYSPGDYIMAYQGYGSSLAEYSNVSAPAKVIIQDPSTNHSQDLVDALFIDNDTSKSIKPTVTQADIDAVQAALDLVVDTVDKTAVQAAIDKATAGLADFTTIEAATTAVNQLFVDNDPEKSIRQTTTQADIDAAQAKIDAVTDATKKAELQAELDKATTAFNVIAPTTISALTTDSVKVTGSGEPNAPVTIKNGTTTIGTGTVKADGT
ncbi:toxin Cry1Ac domain D-VI-related protein, partial [Listeria newyorkensis]